MELDAIITNKLKKFSLRKKRHVPKSPEVIYKTNIRQAIRLIKTGEYNERKKAHRILVNQAHKDGYVDRYKQIVLKEI
jgi:hypothetical protein